MLRLILYSIVASNLLAQTAIMPLKEVRAGQIGIGKTVFHGNDISEFRVEVLGVLENIGPKQSIILARLSGGPLDKTGVMQGMSGSPVYIGGRLVGAVALAFPFATEPIAGIRPIEDMLALTNPPPAPLRARLDRASQSIAPGYERRTGDLAEIATPVSFSGFTARTLDQFAPRLKQLGLEPRQGISSGGQIPSKLGDPKTLRPGDMISVDLLSGDFGIGAEGTVTEVDGNRVYAFGHRFLSVGDTELPFARAEVLTLLPNLNTSFKISSPKQWMGAITQDRSTSVYGELGRKASTAPLTISVTDESRRTYAYSMQMVNDRVLSPLILQMSVFSVIDATERTLGLGSYAVHGEVVFDQPVPPLKLDNSYAGDFNVPLQASTGVATPVSYVLGTGFDALKIKRIALSIDASERKRLLQIDQIAASEKEVHPGERVDLTLTLSGENGVELQKMASYTVPVGVPTGPLSFTAADASSSNLLDYAQLVSQAPKSPAQVVDFLNSLRPNTGAYLRIWRNDASFQAQGVEMPDPPASVALILGKSPNTQGGSWFPHGSKIAEQRIDTGDFVVSGSKTVQVEVKE